MSSDHFTPLAEQYASYRPTYPGELFDWLASIAPQRELAWDCGAGQRTGNRRTRRAFPTMCWEQTSVQRNWPRLHPWRMSSIRVAPAEASGLPDHSVDLITVAQALHWFDLPNFYDEARRVLKPQGGTRGLGL